MIEPTDSTVSHRAPLPQQLRQPRHIDGNSASLVLGQHLGLQRVGFIVPGVDVHERPFADDIAAGFVSACRAGGKRWVSWPILWPILTRRQFRDQCRQLDGQCAPTRRKVTPAFLPGTPHANAFCGGAFS
jgi:hypothetical protein